jgi:hypothetical protein
MNEHHVGLLLPPPSVSADVFVQTRAGFVGGHGHGHIPPPSTSVDVLVLTQAGDVGWLRAIQFVPVTVYGCVSAHLLLHTPEGVVGASAVTYITLWLQAVKQGRASPIGATMHMSLL